MSLKLQQQEPQWLIRLDGPLTLACAAELKGLLLEWLAARKDLALDLEEAEEIDVTIMQLLWTAACEASRTGVSITGRAAAEVLSALRDTGFAQLPGFPIQE